MRKKIKTMIKEYHDENVVCFEINLITSLLEYVRSTELTKEDVSKIVTNVIKHGLDSYALTSADYEFLIK